MEVASFCAAMDTMIDQVVYYPDRGAGDNHEALGLTFHNLGPTCITSGIGLSVW